jgi:hypothetical protein
MTNSIENNASIDAYVNEFKGNLFEYLVSSLLARQYKIETQFMKSIGNEFRLKLADYERSLRKYKPDIITSLPVMAQEISLEMSKQLQIKDIQSIHLIGKVAMASHDNRFDEADILIAGSNQNNESVLWPISLKLSKKKSYVNTKSAGIKSIFTKYFSLLDHNLISNIQTQLNELVDYNFIKLSHQLHEEAGIEYTGNWQEWKGQGLSELPGQIDEKFRVHLKKYYHSIVSFMHGKMLSLFNDESARLAFYESLLPLIGYGSSEIIQVTGFHGNSKLDCIKIEQLKNDLILIKIDQKLVNNTFFNIYFNDRVLQIRLKPMNKFTNTSMKINCSVKYLG